LTLQMEKRAFGVQTINSTQLFLAIEFGSALWIPPLNNRARPQVFFSVTLSYDLKSSSMLPPYLKSF